MRDQKTAVDGVVPGDILRLLAEDGLKVMTQLFNNMYGTGEWPKDLIKVKKLL